MDKLVIEGGRRLEGQVDVGGAKNAALPILAATLLSSGKSRVSNVPQLRDTATLQRLLESLGVSVEWNHGTVTVDASSLCRHEAPYDLVKTMRASILVLGPLLARYGKARVSLPGGCALGPRPVDYHLSGLTSLGAEIEMDHGYIVAEARRLRGTRVVFDRVTVTGCSSFAIS